MLRSASALFLLALASLTAACDVEPDTNVSDDFRGGWPMPAGQEYGPCHHDESNTYHWCDQTGDPIRTAVCAVPQMPDAPHATVCLVRREECPVSVIINGVGIYSIEQDYALACALTCKADDECPTGMTCFNGTCAWETF